jgi:putative colanic acid biosynthesis acetyltransferase WcaF
MNSKKLFIYSLICKFLPPSQCNKFKASLLRWCGAKVGKNVMIMSSAKFLGNMDLVIGDCVFIGHDAFIMGTKGSRITISDNAKIGSRCILVTGYHRFTPEGPCIEGEGLHADIIIEQGAVISTMSIINPGKTIGRMSHVMAGSVVTHDVSEYTRVAGVPAREVKKFR